MENEEEIKEIEKQQQEIEQGIEPPEVEDEEDLDISDDELEEPPEEGSEEGEEVEEVEEMGEPDGEESEESEESEPDTGFIEPISDEEEDEEEHKEKEKPKKKEAPVYMESEEAAVTRELRGLVVGYPNYILFESKEDTLSLIKDSILIYKLLIFCEVKSKKQEIKDKIREKRKLFEDKGILQLIEYYNDYISRGMKFGSSRVKRRMDLFVNANISYIMENIQFWMFILPFKQKKDMHLDTAHGLPAQTAEDFEKEEIEKGEKIVDLNGPFKLDEDGEVIPA